MSEIEIKKERQRERGLDRECAGERERVRVRNMVRRERDRLKEGKR